MQHPDKHTCNLRLKQQMKHFEQTLTTYVYSHCNMCNILIYFCNILMKHLQHPFETSETLETYFCNMRFQRNISLLFGRMEARRRVKFTDVELAGGADLAALVEKATVGPMEKAVVGLHNMRVEHELCAG